jgi:SAM-dependent methyltransferase
MNNFKIIDFRFAEVTDAFNLKYNFKEIWSRQYEYKYVIDNILSKKNVDKPKIHNSSWGFVGLHVIFRDELDTIGECIHSDIVHSVERPTYYYNITTEEKQFGNKFDFVLNISTIEHLDTSMQRISAIENLFKQVKPNGYLILTFDYPRVNLFEIETLVGVKCKSPSNPLNGRNSIIPNINYKDLNIIYLTIRKNE